MILRATTGDENKGSILGTPQTPAGETHCTPFSREYASLSAIIRSRLQGYGLHCCGEGLGRLALLPPGAVLERLDGPRVVQVDQSVELVGQSSLEVVADSFGVGAIYNPYSALEPLLSKGIDGRAGIAQQEQEIGHSRS